MANKQSGMTLVEVLIGLMITALIGVISFNAISAATKTQEVVSDQVESLQALSLFGALWTDDLSQVVARPITDELGVERLAIESGIDALAIVEFSRAGQYRSNVLPVSSLERVRYRFIDNELHRDVWLWLDRLKPEPTYSSVVLTHIESVELVFYRDAGRLQALDRWSLDLLQSRDEMPVAVELIMQHEVYGEVRRVVNLAL